MSTETTICSRIIGHALELGYAISVFNGSFHVLHNSTSLGEITGAMFSSDMDKLYFWRDGEPIGNMLLVYSMGDELICDYSNNRAMTELVTWAMVPVRLSA